MTIPFVLAPTNVVFSTKIKDEMTETELPDPPSQESDSDDISSILRIQLQLLCPQGRHHLVQANTVGSALYRVT